MRRKSCVIGHRSRGFTLVEMLVAVAVFVLIGGVTLNLSFSSIIGQRDKLENQVFVDQISFVAEYMSRAIRQARKDLAASCLATSGVNYELGTSGTTRILRFLDRDNKCREFLFDWSAHAIGERIATNEELANLGLPVALTSSNVEVQDMYFFIDGEDQTDDKQPRVTLFIDGQGLQLQTTISQRRFDVLE